MVERRVCLVIPSLAFGGAERVIAAMANRWADEDKQVTVITLDTPASDTYSLSDRAGRIALGLMRPSRGLFQAVLHNIRRVRWLRQAIRNSRPQTVISFTDKMNVVTLLACLGMGVEVIIGERIDPARHEIGRIWSRLRRCCYPRATALVVQTEAVREQMRSVMRGRPIYVIPNAACLTRANLMKATQEGERSRRAPVADAPGSAPFGGDDCGSFGRIVAMGRLERQKGFDLLIDAFSQISAEYPGWKLEILGEGSQRDALEGLIAERDLQGRVTLAGWVAQPESVLKAADVFVLSSRYEGFPNALLEAMVCGLPAISFDCPSGPGEIIRHEVDGLLVPAEDVAALAAAIKRLIEHPDERRLLAERASEVRTRFSRKRFFAQWEAVLRGEAEDAVARLTIHPKVES